MQAWVPTFTVDIREQLAQWPLHLPGAVDEGRHHPEEIFLVLLPDHRDGLQDELHLFQLMSPWGGKRHTGQLLPWTAVDVAVPEQLPLAREGAVGQKAALGSEPRDLGSDMHSTTKLAVWPLQSACWLWWLALLNIKSRDFLWSYLTHPSRAHVSECLDHSGQCCFGRLWAFAI